MNEYRHRVDHDQGQPRLGLNYFGALSITIKFVLFDLPSTNWSHSSTAPPLVSAHGQGLQFNSLVIGHVRIHAFLTLESQYTLNE